MKWFKHDTDCDKSEGLSYLLSVEGFAGYGRWFRLLEIIAIKMDGTDRCHAEYPIQKWCSLLGLKQKKLISFLKLTENKLKTKVVSFDNVIRIEIPNLLNKRDEYSKRSGQNPDSVRYKKKEIRDKIKDKEKDIKRNRTNKKIYTDDFLKFWECYPKKIGKDAAFKSWHSRNGDRPDTTTLIRVVEKQKTMDQWIKDGGQFIPNPSTWLNQGRWADEIKDEKNDLIQWAKERDGKNVKL